MSVVTGDLFLLRHGETSGQSSVRFYGSTDIGLSELGRQQMRRAGAAFKDVTFRTVIVSPLERSRESASIFLDGRSPEPVVIEDLREIDFGEWEGLTEAEILERDPDIYKTWRESGSLARFPGGESRTEFYRRVSTSARRVFNRTEMPILAVLHKGVIRCILSALLDITVAELTNNPIELGSLYLLRKSIKDACKKSWELVKTNETGHLGECRIKHS